MELEIKSLTAKNFNDFLSFNEEVEFEDFHIGHNVTATPFILPVHPARYFLNCEHQFMGPIELYRRLNLNLSGSMMNVTC